ncbi:DUF2147 domain-containing protein [Rubrivirga sp. S365]|uniref:DUF2147 domain-containing protein n=1 Tax=Rubrivirga litoralis TaxID=3075598 RepID=A0ABU3BTM3_9BACT|nr:MULTISPECIES: DUF2147 domain-containing protein [unclassified Rubrivirga]MDT0632643.1 DUF2147 domain-containing protein [Rubrivirga sp. F394]MDT7857180.1 DUF2147 domain-containing protein [Rubrivirga sp. S365]
MLRTVLLVLAAFLVAPTVSAQSLPPGARAYLGDWTTYDGDEPQSVVRLTESSGVLRGRIVRILPTEESPQPQYLCGECIGEFEGADLRTVPLIEGMEWDGGEFSGGRITDPTNAKRYKGILKLDGRDELRVRGYVGVRALGRTQTWRRAQ